MNDSIRTFMENSSMVFFRPNDQFWEFLKSDQWRWRRYMDIGAGVCRLTRLMRERGFDVDAIDKFKRVSCEIDDLIVGDAAGLGDGPSYDFSINDVMLFARPCHSGFVDLCLKQNIDTGDALYISKPHNADNDLYGWCYKEVAQNVGENGESIYRVWGRVGGMKTFHKIQMRGLCEWWEYRDGRYLNAMGGGFPAGHMTPVETQYAAHAGMLPQSAEGLIRPDLDSGWLAPDGTFYGCGSRDHESVAYDYLCSSTGQLEKMGFARLYGAQGYGGGKLWSIGLGPDDEKKITPDQNKVLKAKGYDVRAGDLVSDAGFPL